MGSLNRITLCTALSLTLSLSLAISIFEEQAVSEQYRLPKTVIPTYYNLSLNIDPKDTVFTGTVSIVLTVVNPISTINDIYLHVDREYISILSVALNDDTDCLVGEANEANILGITCVQGVNGTNNVLSIDYIAKFAEDGRGLVKSKYFERGEEQILVESNFKPTYARRVFPGFDEPNHIANFSIEVTYPEGYTAISNSLVLNENTDSGTKLKTTRFVTTSHLSTYLVSIIISKLEPVYTHSNSEYEVKVFARSEVSTFTNAVLGNYYETILDKFNSYIGISDQDIRDTELYLVALPDYSESIGGFGVFTVRETDVLDDGKITSNRITQDILTTVAYKLAHEWFGGEVAIDWWSDVWVNEAVAIYLEYFITNQVNSNLDILNQFLVEVSLKALQYDAYLFAQPLSSSESEVQSKNDVENKLDRMSYYRGASILRMIKGLFRDDAEFLDGLNYHLDMRKYRSANGSSLLMDLSLIYKENLAYRDDIYEYFQTWIHSPGYPLITVTVQENPQQNMEVLGISQKRFIYPSSNETKSTDVRWTIPINTGTLNLDTFKVRADVFLTPDEEFVYYNMGFPWLLFNVQMDFYYRVNYEEILWKRFINSLKNDTERKEINVLSRAQLIDDIFNVARIGDVSYHTVFNLVDYLVEENEYYPWYAALNAFSYLIGKLNSPYAEENLKIYILNLMANQQLDTEYSPESHIDVLKHVLILEWASKLNHPGIVNNITKEYETYKTLGHLSDYNLRGVVLCNGIRYSKNATDDWQFLWDLYTTTPSVHEQNDILKALGCAEDKNLLKPYLSRILSSDSVIKEQDKLTVFESIFSSSLGITVAKEFLKENITDLGSLGIDSLSEMLYILAEQLVSDEELNWLANILENDIFVDYPNTKLKATELATVNNYWAKNFQDIVIEIFEDEEEETTSSTSTTISSTTITSTISTSESTPGEETTTEEISTTTEAKGGTIYASRILAIFVMLLVFTIS